MLPSIPLFWILLLSLAKINGLIIEDWQPSALPLAVKTPYLSTWTRTGQIAQKTARFWVGDPTDWVFMVRVDGQAYVVQGDPNPSWETAEQVQTEVRNPLKHRQKGSAHICV